jgi:two-component system cell cycle response regulator CtrA
LLCPRRKYFTRQNYAKAVTIGGVHVHLTRKEYQILELLSLRKGSTVTKSMFLNNLYGGIDEPEMKIIDVFICKLRKKLINASNGTDYIETVWGRGWIHEPSENWGPGNPSRRTRLNHSTYAPQ